MNEKKGFLILCFAGILFILNLSIRTFNESRMSNQVQEMVSEAKENGEKDVRYADLYRKWSRLPKDTKYILLWTSTEYEPFNLFNEGQRAFLKHDCSNVNCYVTTDRSIFGENVEKFDVIAFNGRNIKDVRSDIPRRRSPHQIYMYVNLESPANYPVCDEFFNSFFNWTASFKLNSDIVFPYFYIENPKGEIIGPKIDMKWDEKESEIDTDFENILLNKTKAVSWFVSNCYTLGGREKYAKRLQTELKLYNLSLDIYGACGTLICSRKKPDSCTQKLEKEYYFYLAFENSVDKDYVTEKLLTGLLHKTVPIVYGGANYSRFAPPGSYIDARLYEPKKLAAKIANLIASPNLYKEYFKWHKAYKYVQPVRDSICSFCDSLNNKTMVERTSAYTNFSKWWTGEKTTPYCTRTWLPNFLISKIL